MKTKFTIGNNYWVLTDLEHPFVLGKPEMDVLKLCNFKKMIEVDGIVNYCFYPLDEKIDEQWGDNYYSLDAWEMDQLVFNNVDEFLYHLVNHVDNLNSMLEDNSTYEFDDYIKRLIVDSQEENPEVWV